MTSTIPAEVARRDEKASRRDGAGVLDPIANDTPKWLKVTHITWVALALAASLSLVLVPQRGHPPPIVLLPLVLLIWVTGHLFVWGVGWLAVRGRRNALTANGPVGKWPVALIFALLGTGAASLAGLLQLLGSAYQGRWYPYPEPALWIVMLSAWFAHGVCFVGLLLRSRWARLLAAMLALGWAVLLGAQIVEHLNPLARADIAELLVAAALITLLLGLAVSLAASSAVKSFLSH